MTKPRVAITMGDVAGVGPEVIVRAWGAARVHDVCRPLVVGQPEVLRRAVKLVSQHPRGDGRGRPAGGDRSRRDVRVVEVDSVKEADASAEVIPCWPVGEASLAAVAAGRVDARAGRAAYEFLVRGAELALAGEVSGVVTAAISKEALWAAGLRYPGHTEILAELAGVTDFGMMLWLKRFGVVHVTLHQALREAIAGLSVEGIVQKGLLLEKALRRLLGQRPKLAVAALNPHAGEGGIFGDEESRIIAPAVGQLRAAGADAHGPIPCDTLFIRARDGEFDGVVAMYHDQGHIALKLIGFHEAVNVTLGLPFVRTSVAHGTAFDIAWQGKADATSMVEAVSLAARLAAGQRASSAALAAT